MVLERSAFMGVDGGGGANEAVTGTAGGGEEGGEGAWDAGVEEDGDASLGALN